MSFRFDLDNEDGLGEYEKWKVEMMAGIDESAKPVLLVLMKEMGLPLYNKGGCVPFQDNPSDYPDVLVFWRDGKTSANLGEEAIEEGAA